MKNNDRYELYLRLSQAEKEQLETNAYKCGLSKSVYLRQLIWERRLRLSRAQRLENCVLRYIR